MFELVIFTLNAIVIYLLADWLVRFLERQRGRAFGQRQVVFFVIFLGLALLSFALLRKLLGTG
jgi:surface polysaccharide O-acyltransferase-like enzyme